MQDRGVGYYSVTDHDVVWANRELLRWVPHGMHFISWIEITTHYQQKTLHLLAYGFDPEDSDLTSFLMKQRIARRKRAEEIVALLNLDLEKEWLHLIPLEAILALEVEWPITRPDIAKYLIKIGYVKDFREAFDRWLRHYDVPLDSANIYETIDMVHGIRGLPVLAHAFAPYVSIATVTRDVSEQAELLSDFQRRWLWWIELFCSDYPQIREALPLRLAIAERIGLLVTGGSDFHGGDKTSVTLPGVDMPEVYVERFLEKVG
jgi:predicted metal-dependent phosphoesterase TrpH